MFEKMRGSIQKSNNKQLLHPRLVLLAEDDVLFRDMYSVCFRQEGYEIKTVKDGRQAIEWLKNNVPDIIILDIMMPYMDGIETLKHIRENESFKSIPVIMLTNLSETQDISRALEAGADDYLIKAKFTPSKLVSKVNALYWKLKGY